VRDGIREGTRPLSRAPRSNAPPFPASPFLERLLSSASWPPTSPADTGHRCRPHRASHGADDLHRPALRADPPPASTPAGTSTSTRTPGPSPLLLPTTARRSSPPIPSSWPCSKREGRCWRSPNLSHSYPHCWRCHHPVIFRHRAWFILCWNADEARRTARKQHFGNLAIEENRQWWLWTGWRKERITNI